MNSRFEKYRYEKKNRKLDESPARLYEKYPRGVTKNRTMPSSMNVIFKNTRRPNAPKQARIPKKLASRLPQLT